MTEKENLMKKLGCTEEEALDIIQFDKEVNRGADPYPLTAEQKKVERKMLRTGTRKAPTVYKFDEGRQKKANPQKEAIISELAKLLSNSEDNEYREVEIANKTRMITFKVGEKSYDLTLVEKRAPKK